MDNDTQTITQEWEGESAPSPSGGPKGFWSSLSLTARRIVAAAAVAVTVGGLAAVALGTWYLDRFVIAHVEIPDVASYEAALTTPPSTDTGYDDGQEAAVGDPAAEADTASSTTTITETSYTSETTSISIEEVVTGEGDDRVVYYVADIVLDDSSDLRAAFADNAFGTNITEDTSDIAERVGALLAINGDFYGFRDTGIVIRNGVVYRDEPARTGLAMYTDGTMAIYSETGTSAAELVAEGVINTWSFGPALVDGGEIVDGIEDVEVDGYFGKRSMQGENPRTAIGMIDEGHYVFVVVDGRSEGYSTGLTVPGLAGVMRDLGCSVAYNLDGGGSATMYFNGEVVNYPVGTGNERGTSDIIYIAAG